MKYGVCIIFNTITSIRQSVRTIKSKIKYKDEGVYIVLCSCGKVNVGETDNNLKIKLTKPVM